MFKPTNDPATSCTLGSVEFDDRGNSRWIPHQDARTEDTLIRLLAVDGLQLVPDGAIEVHRDGFVETRRVVASPSRRRTG